MLERAQSKEVGCHSQHNAVPVIPKLSECDESPLELEEDEDEDEDVDFNPYLKESPSLEASSSLSSEIEGPDTNVADSGGSTFVPVGPNLLSNLNMEVQECAIGDSEHQEESVMQAVVYPAGISEKKADKIVSSRHKKRKSVLISQPETETICEKENGSCSGTDVAHDAAIGALSDTTHSRKPIMDLDDEDAICTRTRARYSLASFTLDELETFLQETDDDDDLQNVDDEEEYKKFLAAVLLGGDGDNQKILGNENAEDEDEDNDADFEIEIEEALESDLDENTRGGSQKEEHKGTVRRPETRQNKRQKANAHDRKMLLGQAKRPLRPLLPIFPNVTIAPFPSFDGKNLMAETAPHHLSSSAHDGLVNGFTPHQIGQLHCLIHEHVQLLIQVFSLCALEPSRQHIASQVQGLLSEMLHKRDQILSWRHVPFPTFCFRPPYIHPSILDELPKNCPAQCTFESSQPDLQKDCSSASNDMPPSDNRSTSRGRNELASNGHVNSFQINEASFWVPYVCGPVLSILDVAPLSLVRGYMDDISTAVREYQRQHVQGTCDSRFDREPLFPFPSFQSLAEASGEVSRGTMPPATNMELVSSSSHQPPKKTLAAALVESTKKQSVALVHKEIVKLAQKFFPLFNSALFPHKPPPTPVANRVLFTDSEDELLAMGLMEYNSDWKAIQQRFLPCKTKHQIFVRQKNRCSSKAPDNPIKAVRRMKTSPLTAEEKERIQEGLRVFKLDWMSIWKFIVPHRDPSLLPRQWRIAHGIQKSYKKDTAKKEKRRLYELNRRKSKAAAGPMWETVSEKEEYQTENAVEEGKSGDDDMDNDDEAYVHEAFLADWRPEGTHVREWTSIHGSGEFRPQNVHVLEFPAASNYFQNPHMFSHFPHVRNSTSSTMEPSHPVSDLTLKSSKSQFCLRPYRVRRNSSAHQVKLAPDLPPVNLPPSVRIISQSALKSYQSGVSSKISATGGIGGAGTENMVPRLSNIAKSGTSHSAKARQNTSSPLKHNITDPHAQRSRALKDKFAMEERGIESDLHMHPLLFQASEDGRLPYYPFNCSHGTSNSFSFFSGNQPQVNLSLFHNPHQANPKVNSFYKSFKSKESTPSCGIDFHPLLQRSDDVDNDLVTSRPTGQLSFDLESFRGKRAQLQNSFDAVLTEPRVNSAPPRSGTKPSCLDGIENELDLEIHLSSTSKMEKVVGSTNVTENNPRKSASTLNSGTAVEAQNSSSQYHQQSDHRPSVSSPLEVRGKLISGACALVLPSNDILDNIGDQSLPEIVMEQEELSDSDEEIGEHVEFECEEMADSEGEESSDSEQIVDLQDKVVPFVEMEKLVPDVDFDNEQCEPRRIDNPQSNDCITKDSTSPVRLGSTGQERDTRCSSSWLSLNSCPPGCPPQVKAHCIQRSNEEGPDMKNQEPPRPNRSSRKTTPIPKYIAAQKQPMNMPPQLGQDSLAVIPVRKPRKRSGRTHPISNLGMTVESSDQACNNEPGSDQRR